jgi:hypothetical protein
LEVKVEVEGAVLKYAARDIPRTKRGPRGEMEWIQKARATIKVEKPIGFRRVRLPAGEYRLRVEVEDGTSHYLVVEPAARGAEAGGEPGEGAGEGKARDARRKGGEETSFALEKKDEAETDDPPAREPRGKSGQRKPKEAGAEPGGPEAPAGGAADGSMRVPLAVSPTEKTSDGLSFGLRLSSNGSRLRITVRVGSTEARASLRFGGD